MKSLDKGKYHSTYKGYRIYYKSSEFYSYTATKKNEMFKSANLKNMKRVIDKKVRYNTTRSGILKLSDRNIIIGLND